MRVAYIAQHAFHHLEKHLHKTLRLNILCGGLRVMKIKKVLI